MTEIDQQAGSGLPGRRGLTGPGDRQADRAEQSVEAVWLGHDQAPCGMVLTRVRARSRSESASMRSSTISIPCYAVAAAR
jgi:hypothetical protein